MILAPCPRFVDVCWAVAPVTGLGILGPVRWPRLVFGRIGTLNFLFLTERFPWPLEDGGNIRTFKLLEALAMEHRVTVVANNRADLDFAPADTPIGELADEIHLCPANSMSRRLGQAFWRGLVLRESLFVARNWSVHFLRKAQELWASGEYDIVYCNHLDTACYLHQLGSPRAVFDSHNCLSAFATERARQRSFMSPPYRIEAARLRQREAEAMRQSTLTMVCSQADYDHFRQLDATGALAVVPNGAEFKSSNPRTEAMSSKRLLFVGAMDYHPNIDGMQWFCNRVLPLVRHQHPDVELNIVGRSPSKSVRELGELPGVQVAGRVKDVQPCYDDAMIAIVPLREGGGTRLKILEAMAMGCPVVATAKGAEGLNYTNESDIIIADEIEAFADAIVRLITAPQLRASLSAAARQLVRQYDWEVIQADFRRLICLASDGIGISGF